MFKVFREMPKRLFSHKQPPSKPASPTSALSCGSVGWMDAKQSGWFNNVTGELFEGFKIEPDDVFLDVGCGDGGACGFAALQKAYVIASDVDPEKVETVRCKLAESQARGFEAIVSDSNPLPLADGTASKVISLEVIEHVDDPVQFLSELVRVGKPDAQYLITCPDPVAEALQRELAPPAYWAKPNHVRVVQREELGALVERAGLKIEHRGQYSFFWAMYWVLFWAAKQEFGQPDNPLLQHWANTWHALIANPNAGHIKKALDGFMPKSQIVVARKAA